MRTENHRAAFVAIIVLLATLVVAPAGPSASAQGPEILVVTATPTGTVDDRKIVALLTDAGYGATVVDDNTIGTIAPTTTAAAILVTATAAPSRVGTSLTDLAVPVINYEFGLHDDLGLTLNGTANRGERGSFTTVEVTDQTHPILDGLATDAGPLTVLTARARMTYGIPSGEAEVLATLQNDQTRPVLFTYEPGALLANGQPAPARRAGLFLSTSADGRLSQDGEIVVVNTVAWAADSSGEPANRAPSVDAGPDIDATSADPITVSVVGSVTDDGLPEPAAVTVSWTGPADAVFADDTAAVTDVTVPGPGAYTLTLTGNDGERAASDTMTVLVADPNAPPEVLVITATATGTVDDRIIAKLLSDAGFVVTIADDNTISTGREITEDAVLITATTAPARIKTALTGLAVPVVNFEALLHDYLGLTDSGSANRGERGSFTAVDLVAPNHPIVEDLNLAAGSVEVATVRSRLTFGRPGDEAEVVATVPNDPTRPVLFSYEAGSTLANGQIAPARRAGLFPTTSSDGRLNELGGAMVVNTVAWALGLLPPPPPPPEPVPVTDHTGRNTNHDDSPFWMTPQDELPTDTDAGLITSDRSLYTNPGNNNLEGAFPVPTGGQFRTVCEFSHFAYDDPLVHPGQSGRAHLHMFFGNTGVTAHTTYDSLANYGSSTCNGGELNRTGYWAPAMIDGDGNVRVPERVVVYYKGEAFANGAQPCDETWCNLLAPKGSQPYLPGMANISPHPVTIPELDLQDGGAPGEVNYKCTTNFSGYQFADGVDEIPNCDGNYYLDLFGAPYPATRTVLEMEVKFFNCFDGAKAPDDLSGWVAAGSGRGGWFYSNCAGHGGGTAGTNLTYPNLVYYINYVVEPGDDTSDWFLSSDVDQTTVGQEQPVVALRGSTHHADWWGAWHPDINQEFLDNCVNFQNPDLTPSGCGFGYLSDGGPDNTVEPLPGRALQYRPEYDTVGNPDSYRIPLATLFSELCQPLSPAHSYVEADNPAKGAWCLVDDEPLEDNPGGGHPAGPHQAGDVHPAGNLEPNGHQHGS